MQCAAKSKRSRQQCLKWAIRGRNTCHIHGGTARGPKTKIGKERSCQAALRHGGCTKKAKALYKEAMALIRASKDFLQSVNT
jgi:hypothetical protein